MPVSFFMPQVVKAQLRSVQRRLVCRKDNSADPYTGYFPGKSESILVYVVMKIDSACLPNLNFFDE
jgi:hypothetical protein